MAPYIVLALLMLSAVLFAQQASRLAEILIYTDLPVSILGGIGAALLPGVLVFSIPLATLAGIIIGFSRMGSDSEIVAISTRNAARNKVRMVMFYHRPHEIAPTCRGRRRCAR